MFKVIVNRNIANNMSKYRLINEVGSGIKQVNDYLDSLVVRGLSDKTICTYAYYLLDFWKWVTKTGIKLKSINKKALLEYIGYQRNSLSSAATTINHRLTVIGCLYQYHFDKRIPNQSINFGEEPHSSIKYRVGWLHPIRTGKLSLKVKVPYHIIVPLTEKEVFQFFSTLKTWRDIVIAGFMLLCGLRKKEVINLRVNDICEEEGHARIYGKGNRERIVPIPENLFIAIKKYINLERPKNNNEYLFLVLKGQHRGNHLTESGLRTIFRYNRKKSGIYNANPHRFRHTFAAELVKAGISLAVLKKLMGHAYIQTTMQYVNISALDIKEEFNKIIRKLNTKEILNGTTIETP